MGDKCKTKPKINAEMRVPANGKHRKTTYAAKIEPELDYPPIIADRYIMSVQFDFLGSIFCNNEAINTLVLIPYDYLGTQP